MAKKDELEIRITKSKDPAQPDEVLYRAQLVNASNGEVVKGLGGWTYDEDEVAERGHPAIDAEVMERAIAARAKKEEKS